MKNIKGIIECAREAAQSGDDYSATQLMAGALSQAIYELGTGEERGNYGFYSIYKLRRALREAGMTDVEFDASVEVLREKGMIFVNHLADPQLWTKEEMKDFYVDSNGYRFTYISPFGRYKIENFQVA